MERKTRYKKVGFLSSLFSSNKDLKDRFSQFIALCADGKIPTYEEAEEGYANLIELNGSVLSEELIAALPAAAENILDILVSKNPPAPDECMNDKLFASAGMDMKFIRQIFGKDYLSWKIINDIPEIKRDQDIFSRYCDTLHAEKIISGQQKDKIIYVFKLCEGLLVILKKSAIFSKNEPLVKKVSSMLKDLQRESLFIAPLAEKALTEIKEYSYFAFK